MFDLGWSELLVIGIVAAAVTAYGVWSFFIAWKDPPEGHSDNS